MVDVIVTVQGRGRQTLRAIRLANGLVGARSSLNPLPKPIKAIEFIDWPFLEDLETEGGFSVDRHVDVVRMVEPKYAVAPDVQPPRGLEEVLDVAERLDQYADVVIVVPKTVHPSEVPRRYRVGVPFRNEFETNLFRNTFDDFRGEGPVHILGGNPNDQLRLANRQDFFVGSIDTPKPIAWADFGRVFVAAGGSGVEQRELRLSAPTDRIARIASARGDSLALSDREDRIRFSVQNMIQAWNDGEIVYEWLVPVSPGRGPPPVPEDPGLMGPANTFEEKERLERQFREMADTGREEVATGTREFRAVQTTLGQLPDELVDDE